MKTRSNACRASVQRGAGIMLVVVTATSAAATTAPHTRVAVHPHTCVVGQRTFGDLDALVAAMPATVAGPVEVAACGSASIPAWLATVQRLSDHSLEVDVLDASAPACATPAGPLLVSQGSGGALSGVDPMAVERYWSQVQP